MNSAGLDPGTTSTRRGRNDAPATAAPNSSTCSTPSGSRPHPAGRTQVEIAAIQHAARIGGAETRPQWPMIVLRTPKGRTGPKEVDGLPVAPRRRRSTCSCSTTWTASTSSWTSSTGSPASPAAAAVLRQQMVDKRAEHHAYIRRTGEDLPEVRDWTWPTA